MENIYGQLDIIKNFGVTGSPIAPDVSQPVVATKDIATVASDWLSRLDFKGFKVEYVLGQRNLTYKEITKALSEAIGKTDLSYVQFPSEEAKKGMAQMGIQENVAQLLIELADGINSGQVLSDYRRTVKNSTPTSIEEFAQEFAKAYTA